MKILRLWRDFNKRINSTKIPPNDEAASIEVVLKAGTSIERPTFILSGLGSITEFNYCKFEDHYYYINDIIHLNNDVFEIICNQDLLATYRDEIANSNAFVEYSTSDYNIWIPDERISLTSNINTAHWATDVFGNDRNGVYILVVGSTDLSSRVGLVNAYAVNDTQLAAVNTWLLENATDSKLKELYGNAYNAIYDIHWVPYATTTNDTEIRIGDKDTGISAGTVSLPAGFNTIFVDIPWGYNDWRDLQPYTIFQLYIPMYGTINIDQSKLIGSTQLLLNESIDVVSGEWCYYITDNTNKYHQIIKFNPSVSLPFTQRETNKAAGIATIIGGGMAWLGAGIGLAASGIGLPAALGAGIGGIATAAKGVLTYFSEDENVKGGQGSFANAYALIKLPVNNQLRQIRLTRISHVLATDPSSLAAVSGRPLYAWRKLGDLSGYIKCSNKSIDIPGLYGDKEAINQYLNGGFYYE